MIKKIKGLIMEENGCMENIINLKFDGSTTRLAGNPFGQSVYNEQVAGRIDFNKINIIVFPDTVEKVASSFTQGLFKEVIKKVGFSKVDDVVKIKAKTPELEETMHEDLFY